MSRLIRLWAIGAAGLAIAAAAVLAAAPPGRGLVLGRVIADRTGSPIAGATVHVFRQSNSPSSVPAAPDLPGDTLTLIATDDNGRFVFSDLGANSYTLAVSARGFQPTNQPISLSEGERRGDVTVRLAPSGSISGTVMDEYGDPFPGIVVTVRHAGSQPETLTRPRDARTDDRGRYRIDGLASGDYTVVVGLDSAFITSPGSAMAQMLADIGALGGLQSAPPLGGPAVSASGSMRLNGSEIQPMGTLARNAPPPKSDGSVWIYPITYFGDGHSEASARVIALGPGDHRSGADLQLTLVRTARLSGLMRDRNGPLAQQQVFLAPADVNDGGSLTAIGATRTDPQGRFAIAGVPPGRYVLSVLRPAVAATPEPPPPNLSDLALRAMAVPRRPAPAKFVIDVDGLDLDGLDLAIPLDNKAALIPAVPPAAGPSAPARPRAPAGNFLRGQVVDVSPDHHPVRRAVVSIGDPARGGTRIEITDGDGRFVFDNVINLDVPIAATKLGYVSAKYPNAHDRNIMLAMQPAASLSGWIHDSQGRPAAGMELALHPIGEAGRSVNFMRGNYGTLAATTDQAGAFRIWGLPPRAYTLSATVQQSTPMRVTTPADISWALDQLRAGAMASPRPESRVPPPAANGRASTTVYYPSGTTTAADAGPIVVHPGEALEGIELRLPRSAGG